MEDSWRGALTVKTMNNKKRATIIAGDLLACADSIRSLPTRARHQLRQLVTSTEARKLSGFAASISAIFDQSDYDARVSRVNGSMEWMLSLAVRHINWRTMVHQKLDHVPVIALDREM